MKLRPIYAALLSAAVLTGCSLKYEQFQTRESSMPEFTFTNVTYSDYKGGLLAMRLKAETLEQYKDNSSAFAKNADFSSFESGKLNTQGKCTLLSINSKEEIYTLFQNIYIQSFKDGMELTAQNLKWNGKTEQLTSGLGESVHLKRNDLELEGSGFSASGVSQSFKFTGPVKGFAEPAVQEEDSDAQPSGNTLDIPANAQKISAEVKR